MLLGVVLLCAAAAEASAMGLYEAEDAVFSSGSAKESANASGGWYLDGNGGFNITWTVDVEAGDHVLAFNIKVPSGDRTMGVFVNGAQVGTVSTASRSWVEASVEAPMTNGINTIELRDSEGTAELDVDYVFVSRVTTFNYQAEFMALTGYGVVSNEIAANNHFIQLSGDTGTAVQVFGGDAGEYYIDTAFFDETDGACTYELRVDGLLVDSWIADGTFGTPGVSVESLTSHRTAAVQLETNSVIELLAVKDGAEYGRVDEMILSLVAQFQTEAEDMVLDGYSVETNAAASGGMLVRLEGDAGSVTDNLISIDDGEYDLTVGYFDETDGEAAYKVYVNDQLVEAWLADRLLGSSNAVALTRMERTIKRVYLRRGDAVMIAGFKDGGELCRIDGYNLAAAHVSPSVSMGWNSGGTIASLVLNGAEHIDTNEASGVIFRIFDGYSIDTLEQYSAQESGSMVEIHENDFARFYFRMDEYDHHIALRLIGMDGIPREDPSLSIRLKIPYTTLPGYQLLDDAVTVDVSGGILELDWNQLAQRDLLAGGQIALYASNDTAAAQVEIAQVYTDNGKLDPYYAWMAGYPSLTGTDADLFADPDGDGLNNLSEYALGGNPNVGNDGVDPAPALAGDDFEIQYNRRRDAADRGLNYAVKASDGLVDALWSTGGVVDAGSEILDADFESVTNSVSTVGKTNGFLKLLVGIEK